MCVLNEVKDEVDFAINYFSSTEVNKKKLRVKTNIKTTIFKGYFTICTEI